MSNDNIELQTAKKHIENNGEYSYEKMIFQLTWFDFTQEEAEQIVEFLNALTGDIPVK